MTALPTVLQFHTLAEVIGYHSFLITNQYFCCADTLYVLHLFIRYFSVWSVPSLGYFERCSDNSEQIDPSHLLDIRLEPEWLDHTSDPCSFSWGRSILLSIMAVSICILTNGVKHGQIQLLTLSTSLSVKVEKGSELDARRSGLYSHLLNPPVKESWLQDMFYTSLNFLIYTSTVMSQPALPSLTWNNKRNNYALYQLGRSLWIHLKIHQWGV